MVVFKNTHTHKIIKIMNLSVNIFFQQSNHLRNRKEMFGYGLNVFSFTILYLIISPWICFILQKDKIEKQQIERKIDLKKKCKQMEKLNRIKINH